MVLTNIGSEAMFSISPPFSSIDQRCINRSVSKAGPWDDTGALLWLDRPRLHWNPTFRFDFCYTILCDWFEKRMHLYPMRCFS